MTQNTLKPVGAMKRTKDHDFLWFVSTALILGFYTRPLALLFAFFVFGTGLIGRGLVGLCGSDGICWKIDG